MKDEVDMAILDFGLGIRGQPSEAENPTSKKNPKSKIQSPSQC